MASATIRAAPSPGVRNAAMHASSTATSAPIQAISPTVKRRSKPMLLHSPIERGARQPKFVRGERDVVAVLLERLLNQPALDPLEVEIVRRTRGHHRRGGDPWRAGNEREILGLQRHVAREDHRAFERMAQRADIARPVMAEQSRTGSGAQL